MIRIRQIKLKLNHSEKDIKNKIINILKINDNELLSYKINKQSLDARKKITFITFMKSMPRLKMKIKY